MTDFSSNFTPISVPALPASANPDQIATFNAQFVSNIVLSANSVISAYNALKNADFYSVGDIPNLGTQLLYIDPDLFNIAKSRPTRSDPTVDWTTIESRLDQLAALSVPTPPTLTAVSSSVPTLDAVQPTITLPSAPAPLTDAPPGGAPNILDATIPDAPTITLPNAPTFDELQLPQAPTFQLPAWTAVAPQNLLSPPTQQFAYVDPGYVSALHDPLVQKLLGDLQNGTYGIDPTVEDALWFRARDRAAQQAKAAVEEAQRRMASTSFPMPQGTLIEAIDQAEQKAQAILSDANRDIGIKRADMYVEGRKFTIQEVRQYEQVRISLYNAQQERALNAAKATVEMGIAIYDASVRNFSAMLEAYKAEAQVFETRMRGELAKAEIYKAQIDAEKLRAEFNRAKLDIYLGLLKAIDTTVDLYKSRLQAAQIFTQIQGQRLEVFRNQVMAYAERVKAKEAEYNMYQAAIKGQLAGLEVYKAQIEAYNSRIGAIDTQAKIQLQANEALLQNYRAATQNYANQLDAYSKLVTARLEEAKTKGQLYGIDVEAYRAYSTAAMESAKVYSQLNQYNFQWNQAALAAKVAQVEFRLKQLGMTVDLQKDVNAHGTDFMKAALSGAVSGLNSLGVATQSS